jgi:hypothetical protein
MLRTTDSAKFTAASIRAPEPASMVSVPRARDCRLSLLA